MTNFTIISGEQKENITLVRNSSLDDARAFLIAAGFMDKEDELVEGWVEAPEGAENED